MLTDRELRGLHAKARPYKLSLGGIGRFYVLVQPNGTKLFRLGYVLDGVQGTLTLGKHPATSLASARKTAANAKLKLDAGFAPVEGTRSRTRIPKAIGTTFGEVCEEWWLTRKAGVLATSTTKRLRNGLDGNPPIFNGLHL